MTSPRRPITALLCTLGLAAATWLPLAGGATRVGAASAGPLPYRATFTPIVLGVRHCMSLTLRTLHDIHAGEPLTGRALAGYIAGRLTRDVGAETNICIREQAAAAARLGSLPTRPRAVAGHAIAFEGRSALYGRYFLWSVTLPTEQQRDAFLGHMREDGRVMMSELRAFTVGLNALDGTHVPVP